MALSDDKLWDFWNAQGTDNMSKEEAFVFARAIEAEARRDALEEAEKKCELVAQRWSHHMVAPSAALGCAAALRKLKEDTQ